MAILELLTIAQSGYIDGHLMAYYDPATGEERPGSGDTLAQFIVRELIDTTDLQATDEEQLMTAMGILETAVTDLHGVLAALQIAYDERT
jgi:hypothetical protein